MNVYKNNNCKTTTRLDVVKNVWNSLTIPPSSFMCEHWFFVLALSPLQLSFVLIFFHIIVFIVTWWRSKVIGRDGNSATNRKPIWQPTRIWRPLRGKWLREVRQFWTPPDLPAIRRCNFHTLDLATGATLESIHIPIYKYKKGFKWIPYRMNYLFTITWAK